MSNQRGVISILYVILLLIGAAAGTPGQFPVTPEGTVVTPEFLYELIVGVVGPLGLLAATIIGVFRSINARVNAEAIEPGDLAVIARLPEFWLGFVGTVVFIVQLFFNVQLLDENTQALVANAILAVISALLNSWGERPPALRHF